MVRGHCEFDDSEWDLGAKSKGQFHWTIRDGGRGQGGCRLAAAKAR